MVDVVLDVGDDDFGQFVLVEGLCELLLLEEASDVGDHQITQFGEHLVELLEFGTHAQRLFGDGVTGHRLLEFGDGRAEEERVLEEELGGLLQFGFGLDARH
jgi:hypothetical protein